MAALDDYFAGLDAPVGAAFRHIRDLATDLVPGVQEGMSYGMPALVHRGRPLIALRAATGHLSLFPFSTAAVDAVRDRLPPARLSKGTIRFTLDDPLPDEIVRDVVRSRATEIEATAR